MTSSPGETISFNFKSSPGSPRALGSPTSTSSAGGSSEKSVKSCYAVIYSLQNRKWAVSGDGGWSEVHLCHDSSDSSHRLVAWTVQGQQVLLNANCSAECIYKEKSQNFHSFTDENGQRFGLGFHKSDSGLKQAEHFLKAVVTVIENCKKSDPEMGTNSTNKPNSTNRPNNEQTRFSSPTVLPTTSSPSSPSSTSSPSSAALASASSSSTSTSVKSPPPNPIEARRLTTQASISSIAQPKKPPPPPPISSRATVSLSNVNNATTNTNSYNKNNNGNEYTNNNSNVTVSISSVTKSVKVSDNYSSSGLPQVSNYNTNISTTTEVNGLPSPSHDDEVDQEEKEKEGEKEKEKEDKDRPSSPVTAIGGFHFEAKQKMSVVEVNQPDYHLKSNQAKSAPKGTPTLGKLATLPAKPQKFAQQDNKISDVKDVERKVQVTFDKDEGVFHGLPKEWEDLLKKQFGVSPKQIPGVKLPQYAAKIPKVLVTLKEKLVDANGYQQVGIFRLAPDARDSNAVKSSIDAGKFEINGQQPDVNVYANLIKVWFRDLPDPLLSCVAPERVEMANKEADVVKIISDFPEPHKSIFLWLCDMCVECAVYENINKMGPKNLAIVIGPNLFNTNKFENPMKAMTYSAKVVEFFEKAIKWRQSTML